VSPRTERLARYRAARQRVEPRISQRAFEALVAEALDQLPPYVRKRMDNVAVVVQPWPTEEQLAHSEHGLLGLYEGVNRLHRGTSYHLAMPDRITLFWHPIVDEVGDGGREALRAEIRKTVMHEIAHHFGIDDAELERLGV
jgi:predicted Zn-dependent protease with MMP-like domain